MWDGEVLVGEEWIKEWDRYIGFVGCDSTHVTDICSVTELNGEANLSCFTEMRLFKNRFSVLLIDPDS
jgi:hypothetical protein